MNKQRSVALRIGVATGILAILTAVYCLPLMIYAGVTTHHRWDQFWTSAATPYGAATAGFGAIAAGAFTYWNGHKQRQQDRAELAHTASNDDRQHDRELIRDLRARFSSAAEQLAHETTTIQQAGAYAMASLADDWLARENKQEAQVCINVLCTFLRTHHLSKSTVFPSYSEPPPDQAVRGTILIIIADHLRDSERHPSEVAVKWCDLSFDFTDAWLHDCQFFAARFNQSVFFNKAKFTGDTSFSQARFYGSFASFYGCEFYSNNDEMFPYAAQFASTWASGETEVKFDKAIFDGSVFFIRAQFLGSLTAREAQFRGNRTEFTKALLPHVFFDDAVFSGRIVYFNEATIGDIADNPPSLDGAVWRKTIYASFAADFKSSLVMVSFEEASFVGAVSFGHARFDAQEVSFMNPHLWNDVDFPWTQILDWENDVEKPPNVKPDDWPPTPAGNEVGGLASD